MLKDFSFADMNIIYQKTSPFFKSLVQIAIEIIKTSITFDSNPESNASSFSHIAK